MAKNKNSYDLIIVGGGPAGLTLACLLGTHGFDVLCLDREKIPATLRSDFDGRTTAISYGSQQVLNEAGVWKALERISCPIEHIKILDGSSPVLLNFLSEEVEGRAFGNIVENRDFRAELYARISKLKNVTHVGGVEVTAIDATEKNATVSTKDGQKFTAALTIGADGRHSALRKFLKIPTHGWEYGQTAIVACIEHEHPHNNVAIEHFRKEGPFAVLPMRDQKGRDQKNKHYSALVWTVHGGEAKDLLKMDEDVFNIALTARFPAEYGEVKVFGQRFSYPLSLQHAHQYTARRTILIAEAAHAMHPIAGQGLNMGMRDIKALSDLLIDARDNGKDLGNDDLLQAFQSARHFDNSLMMAATDTLNKLFSNSLPLIGPLRRLGVAMVNHVPPAKKFFMHQAMGLKAGLKAGKK